MRCCKLTVFAALLVGAALSGARGSVAQAVPSAESKAASDVETPGIITGHPFSAISFVKTVRNLPNGKQQFLRYDNLPFQIARDSQGRVRIQDVNGVGCEPPTTLIFAPCHAWSVYVFDPAMRILTKWVEGDVAGDGAVRVNLSNQQVKSGETSTSVMPEDHYQPDETATSVTTAKLGEKMIGKIRATGVRTTVVYPAGYSGNKTPITIIHEVWISKEMGLIVRVIDGNPQGEETIAGLKCVSLSPDLESFEPPAGRRIFRWYDKKSQKYADHQIQYLENWFVNETRSGG